MTAATLPQIAALARAGAVRRGWDLFVAGGHDQRGDDPAALAVKGRLLKGQARLASGAEQTPHFAAAAAAYAAANRCSPAPYLAINAATLHLLAGAIDRAKAEANGVLSQLSDPAGIADTPYFLAATRAEAWLLLGNQTAAEQAMTAAARADPDGWADRAATVMQLREIAAAQRSAAGWIDRFAPPVSWHFAGHMGITSGGSGEVQLQEMLAAQLAATPVGFGWGALAAGADIVIAEALVAQGAALHVVLPCPPCQFEVQSVAPAGSAWSARYTALLAKAASVRVAADHVTSAHDPLATAFAGELAIGGALNNAATLSSSAGQLIVTDARGGGANTSRQAAMWRASSGPQIHLTVPRDTATAALFPPEQFDPARRLGVHLAITHERLRTATDLPSAELAALAAPVSAALAGLPQECLRAAPGGWQAVLPDLEQALDTAARLTALGTVAVGTHLAIGPVLRDDASGALVPYGPAPALAQQLAALAPPGTALASDALAVTMAARGSTALRAEMYHQGSDELGGALHALLWP